jgi:hypothetical protein
MPSLRISSPLHRHSFVQLHDLLWLRERVWRSIPPMTNTLDHGISNVLLNVFTFTPVESQSLISQIVILTSIDREVVGKTCIQLFVGRQGRRAAGTTHTVARVQVQVFEKRGLEGKESGTRTDVGGFAFGTRVRVVDGRIPSDDPNNGEVESFVRSEEGLRCQILSYPCLWRSTHSCMEA